MRVWGWVTGMATARAHPTMAPAAWRPQGPGRIIAASPWRRQGPTRPWHLLHGDGKGPPDHGTCGMATARAGEVHCATGMAIARAHRTVAPATWRPQGPTPPRPTSL